MTTKPQSPIERLREIAAEQNAIIDQMTCIVGGITYAIDADGETINEYVPGCDVKRFSPVTHIRAIAREILGMVEPSEVPAAPEPTESKQEPWGYAVDVATSGGFFAYREKDNAENAARVYSGQIVPLYAAPVKATVWAIRDKHHLTTYESDPEDVVRARAREYDRDYPNDAPHRVVGLAEVAE